MTTTPQPMIDDPLYCHRDETIAWRIDYLWAASKRDIIRFLKMSRSRCLLDQNARWTPDGWDQSRWVPKPPIVPQGILRQVEGKLRQQQEAQH